MIEQAINDTLELMDEKFKSIIAESDDSHVYWHHGFGTRVRNQLRLWEETNPLVKWFSLVYGISHADDISGVLVNGAFHKLRGLEFDPQPQIDRYLEHWSTVR